MEKYLDNYILKSLKMQTADYELILIDNTENEFKSAAEALNYSAQRCKR